MLDAELVEHADDRAAQVLAAVRRRSVAAIAAISASSPRCCSPASSAANARAQLVVVLEPQPRGEALGGERAGELGEDRERVLALAAVGAGCRASATPASARRGLELERAAQVLLAAGLDERVGLGGQQRVEEARDDGGRLRADELGRDARRP